MEVPAFPKRADGVHKGDVGRIVVFGGRFDEVGMVGAPALVANAAFRVGAGLVQVITTEAARAVVAGLAPCATTRVMGAADGARLAEMATEFRADVVAIGPGLSPTVTGADVLGLVEGFDGGVVIDADGLNALATVGKWCVPAGRVVVTPHPGEMRRLVDGLAVEVADREACARAVSMATGAVVVLKGAGTVVSDGGEVYVNSTGHSGMASGGMGDVLTGVIAGLMGQRMDSFEAAVLGVWLHGKAGEIAGERVGRVSVMATDVVDSVGEAIVE